MKLNSSKLSISFASIALILLFIFGSALFTVKAQTTSDSLKLSDDLESLYPTLPLSDNCGTNGCYLHFFRRKCKKNYYRISACNQNGDSSYSNIASVTTIR